MKYLKVLFFGTLLFFVAGCQPSFFEHFKKDTCDVKRWTDEQCRAAFRRGTRFLFGKEKPGGNNEFEVNYGVLQISEVDEQVKNLREDLRAVLDYNNKPERKFIDVHNLGLYLEHQEKVFEALDASLQAVSLNGKFQRLIGFSTGYSYYGYSNDPHGDSYSLKKIFGNKDILATYPFNLDQIEDARKQGKLEVIESVEWKINRMLDRKIPDPDDPSDPKDVNRFIWRPRTEWLSATTYKIWDIKKDPKPQNSFGNYIEVFRMTQDNKKESYPALKIFFPYGTDRGVMVLDSDREGKDPGFGLPDFVEQVTVSSLRDIMQNQTLLSRIFEEKDRRERIRPNPKPVFAEIARVGQPMDMWEKALDAAGWKVSLKYQNTLKNNYNIHIKLDRDKRNTDDGQPPDIVTKIEYIAKEWTGSDQNTPSVGQVWEYFKPKADFAFKNITKAKVIYWESTKKIVLDFEDGSENVGTVTPGNNKYIESEPYAIEYTEGQKRWRLEKDLGSSIFNKRKEVTMPKTVTGIY